MLIKIDLARITPESITEPGLNMPILSVSAIITYFVTKSRLAWGNETPNYYDSKSCLFHSLEAAKGKVESIRKEKGQSYRIDQTPVLHFEGQDNDLLVVDLTTYSQFNYQRHITLDALTFSDAIRCLVENSLNTCYPRTSNFVFYYGSKGLFRFEPLSGNTMKCWHSRSNGIRYLLNWYSGEVTRDVSRTFKLAKYFADMVR